MLTEIEAAAADGIGSFFRHKPTHALPIGTPCPNCETPLQGPWCHACGQKGEEFHRSIGHLVAEAVEGLTHFDGRLWQTVPDLVRNPARLTRGFLDGHRAPQIPPFRLFLIVVVIVFFAHGLTHPPSVNAGMPKAGQTVTLAEGMKIRFDKPDFDSTKKRSATDQWLVDHFKAALSNPQRFRGVIGEWAHRLAVLALPVAAGLLGLLFLGRRRRFYMFDHLIFSMHSLSFQGLLLSASYGLGALVGGWSQLVLLAAPAHLFFHMRGVYQTSVPGTLARMALLFVGSLIGFLMIFALLFFLGLNAVGAHA